VEGLSELARGAGLEVVECEYATVLKVNRKNGLMMRRVFVHGVFRRRDEHAG
jgi:hypothetical protein